MTKQPHPQAEMLKAIAEDASLAQRVEVYRVVLNSEPLENWYSTEAHMLLEKPDWVYRFKPREFKKGWWYPAVVRVGNKPRVVQYLGILFSEGNNLYQEKDFKYIGEGYLPDFGDY